MLQGFKDFIMKGNVVDLAVAVIMGGAFAPVITTLVDSIIMPLISGLIGFPSFDQFLAFQVGDGENYVRFGAWLTVIINFLIIAAALYFVVVMPMNKMIEARNKRLGIAPDEEEVEPDVALLTEIRDLLAGGGTPKPGSAADKDPNA
ncbi:large conductance mechanosensitive channel protein MscL [Kocuria sp. JC486]|uniref:Large-conductance mechanosensitive channel n=1 Tax=Kocuria soli TaxID=2485125 RepID=A0A3N4A4H7_9MICC|nr:MULTISPECIES: large conductance mechanosensitive channel protein MscL [Kocuria]NHU84788.1 large conductance mechanosensitive channel protein MscL [Kocuria sp. JC486]ROZ63519.1 large conductance mechanosensitive channel protein MscL [Kocuria soli]